MLNLGTTTRRGRRARPAAVGLTAIGLGALLAVGFVAPATAAVGDPAESSSQFLTVSGLDLSAADLAGTYASAPGGPASSTSAFQAAVYGALADSVALLGGGLGQEPLVYDGSGPEGLLAVAQTDIAGYSSSDLLSAVAANGAVDPATGAFTELASGGSTVNLAATFDALGVSQATREVLSRIDLEVGTVASRVVDGAYTGATGDYRLDGLSLELTSPLLQQLPDLFNVALEGATVLAQELLEAAAPGGIIPLPAGTIPDIPIGIGTLQVGDVTLTVTAPNFDNVVADVMSTPGGVIVVSDDGVATVNLNTGQISIDLAPILGGTNGLAPNTEVFTTATMTAISNSVANALGKTTPLFAGGVESALLATPLGMSVDVAFVAAPNSATPNLNNLTVATGTLTGSGSLNDYANGTSVFASSLTQAPGLPACARPLTFGVCLAPTSVIVGGAILAINAAVPTLLPPAIAVVAAPLMAAFETAADAVIAELDEVMVDVYASISSAFDGLMPALALVVINEQPAVGDLGPDSFTVRALGVTFLPDLGLSSQAQLGLATSTALALPAPTVDIIETEVAPNKTVDIVGTGWDPAGGPVTLVFADAGGNPVGTATAATPGVDGAISATWTVPAGTADGVLTLTASQGELSRTDTLTVRSPAPTPKPVPEMAVTGSESMLLPFGLAASVLLAAGAMLLAARSRRG